MSKQIEALAKARKIRSDTKRLAVEDAIAYLQEHNKVVTFAAIAKIAKVCRAYLYNNSVSVKIVVA